MEVANFLSGGAAGVLAMVVAYLLRSNHQDRGQFQTMLERESKRANEAEQRVREERLLVDQVRQGRFTAEESAAKERVGRIAAERTSRILRSELSRLRARVGVEDDGE